VDMGEGMARRDPITRLVVAAVAGLLAGCAGAPPRGDVVAERAAPAPEAGVAGAPPAIATDADVGGAPEAASTDSGIVPASDAGVAVIAPAPTPDAAAAIATIASGGSWCGSEGFTPPPQAVPDPIGRLDRNICGVSANPTANPDFQPGLGPGRLARSPAIEVQVVSAPANLPCAAEACGVREAARACFTRTDGSGSVWLSIGVAPEGTAHDVRASVGGGAADCLRAAVGGKAFSCRTSDGAPATIGVKVAAGASVGPRIEPKVTTVSVAVNGRLPSEVVARVIRQRFGAFVACYRSGLSAEPELRGRVAVGVVIDPRGGVAAVADAGSDLPAPGVRACVINMFRTLSFPAPQGGGTASVSYVLAFEPR
jgi:hypothetical protein